GVGGDAGGVVGGARASHAGYSDGICVQRRGKSSARTASTSFLNVARSSFGRREEKRLSSGTHRINSTTSATSLLRARLSRPLLSLMMIRSARLTTRTPSMIDVLLTTCFASLAVTV